jgi:hypothetical protein
MVSAGDVDRVELEGAESVDDPHDALGLRRQASRRREEVAVDEKHARDIAADRPGRHAAGWYEWIADRSCQVRGSL